jgi:hypothetical protein
MDISFSSSSRSTYIPSFLTFVNCSGAEAAVGAFYGAVFNMFYDLNVPYAADEAQLTNTLNFLAEGKR